MIKAHRTKALYLGLALILLAQTAPTTAQAGGIMEFFFPSLAKEEVNLYETLRAPFAEAPPPTEKIDAKALREARLPENSVPLEKAHRQNKEIARHVSEMVSTALLFENANYKQDIENINKNFTPKGQTQYKTFLKDNNLLKTLETNKFYIRGFVKNTPLLLNAKSINGRYRWLFEIPIMLSYSGRDIENYKEGLTPTNIEMIINVQVGRYKEANNEVEILIESWSGKVKKQKKK